MTKLKEIDCHFPFELAAGYRLGRAGPPFRSRNPSEPALGSLIRVITEPSSAEQDTASFQVAPSCPLHRRFADLLRH